MAKQYSFKLNKKTEWLAPILDQLEGDRSAFIREMVILGMQSSGYTDVPTDNSYFKRGFVSPSQTISVPQGITKEDQVRQEETTNVTPRETKVTQKETKEDKKPPSILSLGDIEEEDDLLEQKLDNLYD